MNDTGKKFDHFRLNVYTHAGDDYANISFNLQATDATGRKQIQNLTYKEVKRLCAVIGNIIIKEVKS